MADLLTHILVPFIALTALRWRVAIDRRWIPVAMGGAAVPDLGKIGLLLDEVVIQTLLGSPFSYGPIGTVAGVLVISVAISVWFGSERHVAYAWLVLGGTSALVLDGLRVFADGFANFWLYPLWWRPPTPNLYVSSDYRVTAVAVALALVVFVIDRHVHDADR